MNKMSKDTNLSVGGTAREVALYINMLLLGPLG